MRFLGQKRPSLPPILLLQITYLQKSFRLSVDQDVDDRFPGGKSKIPGLEYPVFQDKPGAGDFRVLPSRGEPINDSLEYFGLSQPGLPEKLGNGKEAVQFFDAFPKLGGLLPLSSLRRLYAG